ncbi:hypothetical protein ACRYI5_01360 [Furfurilactobacillus sp. WILCCON 0119]
MAFSFYLFCILFTILFGLATLGLGIWMLVELIQKRAHRGLSITLTSIMFVLALGFGIAGPVATTKYAGYRIWRSDYRRTQTIVNDINGIRNAYEEPTKESLATGRADATELVKATSHFSNADAQATAKGAAKRLNRHMQRSKGKATSDQFIDWQVDREFDDDPTAIEDFADIMDGNTSAIAPNKSLKSDMLVDIYNKQYDQIHMNSFSKWLLSENSTLE